MRFRCLLATASIFAFSQLLSVSALTLEAPTDCDLLAAHPDDPARVSVGVKRDDRDPVKAIPACEVAVRQYPGHPRFEYQLGLALDKANRQPEAAEWYRRAAVRDYVAAIYTLGWAYMEGEGVAKNEAQGFRLIKQAAEKGHSAAKNTIGVSYQQGRGVTKNEAEAVQWFRMSAEEGRAGGLYNLASAYRDGSGVARNNTEALRLFRLAAEQEHLPSMSAIGWMIEKRRSANTDPTQAIAWYERAATGGHDAALKALDRLAASDPSAALAAERSRLALAQAAVLSASLSSDPSATLAADPTRSALAPAAINATLSPDLRLPSPAATAWVTDSSTALALPPLLAHQPPAASELKPDAQAEVVELAKRDPDGWVFFVVTGVTSGKIRSSIAGDTFIPLPQHVVICGKVSEVGTPPVPEVVLALAAPDRQVEVRTVASGAISGASAMISNLSNECDLVALKAQDYLRIDSHLPLSGGAPVMDKVRAVRFVSSADVAAVNADRNRRAEEEALRREELRQSLARGDVSGHAYLYLARPSRRGSLCHTENTEVVKWLYNGHRAALAAEIELAPDTYQKVADLDAWFGAMLSGQCILAAGQPRNLAEVAVALKREGIEVGFASIYADDFTIEKAREELARRGAAEEEARRRSEAERRAEAERREAVAKAATAKEASYDSSSEPIGPMRQVSFSSASPVLVQPPAQEAPLALSPAERAAATMPDLQKRLIAVVENGRATYEAGINEMQKGAARPARAKDICSTLTSFTVSNWVGQVERLSSNNEGKGVLTVMIAQNMYVQTWSNALSDLGDNTLIEPESAMFTKATALDKNQWVTFSGSFLRGDSDCIRESSLTLQGSLTEPEFIFRFSVIDPIQ